MKRIVVNGRFLLHKTTGVERYAKEILNELDKLINKDEIILAIPQKVKEIPNYNNIKIDRVGIFDNRLWEHVSFPRYVKKRNAIPLNLCNVAPLTNPGIVTIHDAKIKARPEFFSRKFIVWYNILFNNETKNAELILTDSIFSKNELLKYYKINENKIKILPCGWQHYNRIAFDEGALDKYSLKKNQYFFAMGSMEPNKNFKWIAEIAKNNPKYFFAIAGSINPRVFSEGLGFNCPSNMKLLGFVSDEEAKTLMRDCKAFLFPSFYEGFGLPPLEAMSSGCNNVVVSDIPVMHELFGNEVNYINPNKHDINLSEIKSGNFKRILDKYSWKKSAKLLYEILEEM